VKILILGGDGFLGSNFVDQAVTLGHDVTVFDRFPYQYSRNLEHQRGKIKFISGEFANREDVSKATKGQDIVYHFVCATSPAGSWNDPYIEIEENLRTSIQFFEIATSAGVKKIVFPSSGGTVYGPQLRPVNESAIPRPFSPYGITKLSIEHFLHYFQKKFDIAVDIYRVGNAYGPRQPDQRPQGVIGVWMRDIINGSEIQVFGDQDTLRDYVYIEDVAFLMTGSLRDPIASGVYNLGSGEGTSIVRLLDIFKTSINTPFSYKIHPRRALDNSSIVLDSSKLLAFFPGFNFQKLEDKISVTWEYFKNRQSGGQITASSNIIGDGN
jgi:UDP-glucose 4-epimerase